MSKTENRNKNKNVSIEAEYIHSQLAFYLKYKTKNGMYKKAIPDIRRRSKNVKTYNNFDEVLSSLALASPEALIYQEPKKDWKNPLKNNFKVLLINSYDRLNHEEKEAIFLKLGKFGNHFIQEHFLNYPIIMHYLDGKTHSTGNILYLIAKAKELEINIFNTGHSQNVVLHAIENIDFKESKYNSDYYQKENLKKHEKLIKMLDFFIENKTFLNLNILERDNKKKGVMDYILEHVPKGYVDIYIDYFKKHGITEEKLSNENLTLACEKAQDNHFLTKLVSTSQPKNNSLFMLGILNSNDLWKQWIELDSIKFCKKTISLYNKIEQGDVFIKFSPEQKEKFNMIYEISILKINADNEQNKKNKIKTL